MHNVRNPGYFAGRRLKISITIDPDQVQAIDALATLERSSRAALFRRALDLFLADNIARLDIARGDDRKAA